ncbi:MAG TPA: M36 family metallopeptidase, partial [Baekduia sp.]|nr:M36 family metallopeptidase [Baekduia sp.]
VPAATADAREALGKRLGPQGTIAADPVTGGLRSVGRADGFLTGPSQADPATIALDYVRAHADAFGLDATDIATLRQTSRSTSANGVTHLAFGQFDGGIAAYDSALTANVTADGRLVNAGGAPVHDLEAPSTDPPLGPAAARTAALEDLGLTPDGQAGAVGGDAARTTTFADGDRASLVTLADPDGDHLAWKLTVGGENPYVYEVLVDAATGAVLARHSLTDFLTSNASVLEHHPGDGTLHTADIGGWLSGPTVTGLVGPSVHAYADRVSPDGIGGDGEISPSSTTNFWFTTTPAISGSGQHCPSAFTTTCTWNGTTVSSASVTANLGQATTQVFYYTNKYHDWLEQPPIGFTPESYNFEVRADTASTGDDDPLDAETDDSGGYNNANMSTPADGLSPTMQMYLFKAPYPAVNGADDATVVYHEYTHGLTNRLVGGDGAANGLLARQSQAMGEGWSDWYALDFLTAEGLIPDTATPGEQVMGAYVTDDVQTGIRANAIDCPVDAVSSHCPGTSLTGAGGFTFGDLGRVDGYDVSHPLFEVHADGEIWAETLWDLRRAVGGPVARGLVTEALRLAPKQPSFLDMRNSILAADTVAGGTHRAQIWTVFAARGMGYSASTTSANSTHAVEAFDTPPVAAAGAPDVTSAPLESDTVVHVPITNPTGAPLTNVQATLAPASAGVTVPQATANIGTLAGNATAAAAFTVRVAAAAGCGSVAATTLTIASDQGTQSLPLNLPVGSGRAGAVTRSYPAPVTIADNQPAGGVTSTLTIPSHGRVGDLRVTLAATHAWIGDLHAWLTAPSGTTVDLMERPGTDTGGYFSRANLAAASPVVFDDDAGSLIQELPDSETTVAGAWRPNQPLARFAGEDRYGTWTLRVTDSVTDDTGTLTSWSLETADPACAITDAPSGLVADAATFHARLDPGTTAATTAAFELGTTAAYTGRSPAVALTTGGGLQSLTTSTTGLTPGLTYHVRAIAVRNGTVVAAGADRTFVAGAGSGDGRTGEDGGGGDATAGGATPAGAGGAATTLTAPIAPPALTVPKATIKGLASTVRLDRKGRFTLTFRATPARALSTIKVRAARTSAGSSSFTVPAGGRVRITVRATRKVRAALRTKLSVKTKAIIRIGVTSFTATLTIKPYKKTKR